MLARTAPAGCIEAQIAVTQESLSVMAGIALSLVDEAPEEDLFGSLEEPLIDAVLGYGGAFEGSLHLVCRRSLAFAFTERCMRVEPPMRLDQDVRDAVGELTNVIGGALKNLLAEGTSVTMPEVFEQTLPQIERLCELAVSVLNFTSELGGLRLVLLDRPS